MKNFIVIFGIWFLCGAMAICIWIIRDLRGEEYREDYIDENTVMGCFLMLIGGIPSLFFTMIVLLEDFLICNTFVTELLYKIANIGLKKEDGEDESTTD